jgi:NitT/TauT family transport system substrate-binding protein
MGRRYGSAGAHTRRGWSVAVHAGLVAALAIALLGSGASVASAQMQVILGSAAPPSNSSYLLPIIEKYGLDKKHGLQLENRLYSDLSNLYADFASHRNPVTVGGLFNAAAFYARGVPVRLLCTISLANHALVTTNPDIRTAEDLKGKTIAANTSAGFYALALIYFREHGLDPRANLNVISSALPAIQSQLAAGRVDAGLMWEPGLSTLLMKGYRPIGDMAGDIRKDLKLPPTANIWFIGMYAWQDWIDENPKRALATMQMLQEAVHLYETQAAEVDPLISAFTKVPLASLQYGREHGLVTFKVLPAIEDQHTIDVVLAGFKSVGFIPAVPDAGIYYKWPEGTK